MENMSIEQLRKEVERLRARLDDNLRLMHIEERCVIDLYGLTVNGKVPKSLAELPRDTKEQRTIHNMAHALYMKRLEDRFAAGMRSHILAWTAYRTALVTLERMTAGTVADESEASAD